MLYFIAPFIGWFVSGIIKFIINYIRFGEEAKKRIGNGGFPSTHTTIMTTTTLLIGLAEGFLSPIFGLAVAVTYIIIIDATGLRMHVGKHAYILNRLERTNKGETTEALRESMGHTKVEILGGLILGTILAFTLNIIFKV
ncbi:divergent PAP2 family protein [Bacillaceae bacterium CLA-AA-H227]|uniref:Divergent PAP2 family protein n=1 Tax=Robertmurraya yapensis (ex Hitch et al 2024) TaxID=3133160 RepID=A0ACC6SBY3_9BACI